MERERCQSICLSPLGRLLLFNLSEMRVTGLPLDSGLVYDLQKSTENLILQLLRRDMTWRDVIFVKLLDFTCNFPELRPVFCDVASTLERTPWRCPPHTTILVLVEDIDALHRELIAKIYKYVRHGIEELPWCRRIYLTDPCGNRLRFCEPSAS